jgi:hypothetical protein
MSDLMATFRTIPLIAFPLLLILGPTPWRDAGIVRYVRAHRLLLVTLGVCFAFAVSASSRIGAGSHHILPFVPILGYEYVRLHQASNREHAARWPWALRYAGACFALVAMVRIGGGLWEVAAPWRSWGAAVATREEARSALGQFEGGEVAMGYGDAEDPATFFQPEIVFATNRLHVDEIALSDMGLDGVALPDATVRALDDCSTRAWLIPRGKDPFALPNLFADLYPALVPRQPLFPAGFRSAFLRHYSRAGSTEHFDLWVCHAA